ncbi:hypothetical protein SELMODRAFT_406710 [Selaginella moellendorffii]|uniref:Uncharacterized protein n=1 Tax=Selaginella moellendorffii TaxID=88036 RepID=D8R179_SELML|nr:hypothetical protein SELMODRAFT_406710 [Selaginella moellendorffii]
MEGGDGADGLEEQDFEEEGLDQEDKEQELEEQGLEEQGPGQGKGGGSIEDEGHEGQGQGDDEQNEQGPGDNGQGNDLNILVTLKENWMTRKGLALGRKTVGRLFAHFPPSKLVSQMVKLVDIETNTALDHQGTGFLIDTGKSSLLFPKELKNLDTPFKISWEKAFLRRDDVAQFPPRFTIVTTRPDGVGRNVLLIRNSPLPKDGLKWDSKSVRMEVHGYGGDDDDQPRGPGGRSGDEPGGGDQPEPGADNQPGGDHDQPRRGNWQRIVSSSSSGDEEQPIRRRRPIRRRLIVSAGSSGEDQSFSEAPEAVVAISDDAAQDLANFAFEAAVTSNAAQALVAFLVPTCGSSTSIQRWYFYLDFFFGLRGEDYRRHAKILNRILVRIPLSFSSANASVRQDKSRAPGCT